MVAPKTHKYEFYGSLPTPDKQWAPWVRTASENIKETGSREHYYARLFSHGQKLGDYDP